MTTGEKIRAARKRKGLTQKQLGELCGIAEPTIRRYELGKLNPKMETLIKIAEPLGVNWDELTSVDTLASLAFHATEGDGEKYELLMGSYEKSELVKLFSKLNEGGRLLVLDYARMLVANAGYLKDDH